MFSSLDKIDIVLEGKDGRTRYVQTDHRTAQEVEAQAASSTLMALVRVLNPMRAPSAGGQPPLVEYFALNMTPVPAFLRQAVQAAGGIVRVANDGPPEPPDATAQPLDVVVQRAFADMARDAETMLRVSPSLAGVQQAEARLAAAVPPKTDNEIAYWTAVLWLGSLAGEVLRATNGGRWVQTGMGSLPFALETSFRGGAATINPLGKAIKRFANGEGDSVAVLIESATRAA
jgi:hypothetical protein